MHDLDRGVWCLATHSQLKDMFFVPIGSGWAIIPKLSLEYEHWHNTPRESCVDLVIEKALECQLQFAVSGEPAEVDLHPPF